MEHRLNMLCTYRSILKTDLSIERAWWIDLRVSRGPRLFEVLDSTKQPLSKLNHNIILLISFHEKVHGPGHAEISQILIVLPDTNKVYARASAMDDTDQCSDGCINRVDLADDKTVQAPTLSESLGEIMRLTH